MDPRTRQKSELDGAISRESYSQPDRQPLDANLSVHSRDNEAAGRLNRPPPGFTLRLGLQIGLERFAQQVSLEQRQLEDTSFKARVQTLLFFLYCGTALCGIPFGIHQRQRLRFICGLRDGVCTTIVYRRSSIIGFGNLSRLVGVDFALLLRLHPCSKLIGIKTRLPR